METHALPDAFPLGAWGGPGFPSGASAPWRAQALPVPAVWPQVGKATSVPQALPGETWGVEASPGHSCSRFFSSFWRLDIGLGTVQAQGG